MSKQHELPEQEHDDHPPHLLDDRFYHHANQPRNMGPVINVEGKATGVGSCGDSLEIFLSIQNDEIANIGHIPHGCIYTVACGSAMTQIVSGKSLEDALRVTPEDVASELGGLPHDHMHCASLAVNTLGEAIEDYYRKEWGNSAKNDR
ncbi:MAG: iron-sulfur cluster assembly scaffold protein [Desulfatirhabdiaceae bacterium]